MKVKQRIISQLIVIWDFMTRTKSKIMKKMNQEMNQKGDETQVRKPRRYTGGADARGAEFYAGRVPRRSTRAALARGAIWYAARKLHAGNA